MTKHGEADLERTNEELDYKKTSSNKVELKSSLKLLTG
jgi:hypothetical protein